MSEELTQVRIDKWLWAVRLYKTRSLAIEACKAGHVKVGGKAVKPARSVEVGDIVMAMTGNITRTVKAVRLLERRVGAKVLDQYVEDLTPESEYEKIKESIPSPLFQHSKGKARPTKRDRRAIDQFKEEWPFA